MKTSSLLHKHLVPAILMLASIGLINAPAFAQPAKARWAPRPESIVVTAGAPRNWHLALSASRLGKAFVVSATIPVPYADLNLAQEQDATELGRRIQVAARLVCQELDSKYPPTQFPVLEGYSGSDCVRATARGSMEQADLVIASARH